MTSSQVSEETRSGGDACNKKRDAAGMRPMTVIGVDVVDGDADDVVVSLQNLLKIVTLLASMCFIMTTCFVSIYQVLCKPPPLSTVRAHVCVGAFNMIQHVTHGQNFNKG